MPLPKVFEVTTFGVCRPATAAPESMLTAAAVQDILIDLNELNLDAVSSDNTSVDSKVLIGTLTFGFSALALAVNALTHAVNEQTQQMKESSARVVELCS